MQYSMSLFFVLLLFLCLGERRAMEVKGDSVTVRVRACVLRGWGGCLGGR